MRFKFQQSNENFSSRMSWKNLNRGQCGQRHRCVSFTRVGFRRTDRRFICCTARSEAENNIGAAINEVDVQVPCIKSIHRHVLTPSRWTGKLSDVCLSHDRLLDSYRGYVHMQFGAFSFTMKVWSLVAGIGVQGIGVTLELKVRTSPCDVQLRLCEVLRDHPVARAVPA